MPLLHVAIKSIIIKNKWQWVRREKRSTKLKNTLEWRVSCSDHTQRQAGNCLPFQVAINSFFWFSLIFFPKSVSILPAKSHDKTFSNLWETDHIYHRHFSSLAHSEVCSVFLVNRRRPGMKVTSMRIQGDANTLSRAGTSPMTETSSVPVISGATTWLGCMDFDLEGWVAPTHLNRFPWLHNLVTLYCEPILWVGREVARLQSLVHAGPGTAWSRTVRASSFWNAWGYEERESPWWRVWALGGRLAPMAVAAHLSSLTAGSPKDEEKTYTLVEEAPHSVFRSVHCGFKKPCFY